MAPRRIALVTDAWLPQVNGVTTTLGRCVDELRQLGHTVDVVCPDDFATVPCPRYPEIRLAAWPWSGVARRLARARPEAVHIATEGPLGLAARRWCRRHAMPFTTAFHTRFPEYLEVYLGLPVRLGYRLVRWFHAPAERTLVPTPTVARELAVHGFDHLVCWTRGVDAERFRPGLEPAYDLPRPVFLCVGRVAPEKNLEAFLGLDLPGSKVVVGDGPALASLRARYPSVHWAGARRGEDLARHFAGADVFVFPSRSDTFGVVMLEAAASGLPVAAFPVAGPVDVVVPGVTGVLDSDLGRACREALTLDRRRCRAHAEALTWRRCAEMLLDNLAFARDVPSGRATVGASL